MRLPIALVVGSWAVLCAAPRPASPQPVDPHRIDLIAEYLSRLEGLGYSGAVLIARGEAALLKEGYGARDRELGAAIDTGTVFTIGSITKQFTAAAILGLVEDGRLRLDDTLPRFFRGVPADKRAINVHQLLTHTAGLVNVLGDDFDTRATRDWLVQRALKSQLIAMPGTEYRYSNLGYSLLAAIVEIVAGGDYETYLRDRLFAPAGLRRTGYVLPDYGRGELAVGYRPGHRWGTVLERAMLADGPSWNLRGNGGIHSTLTDMHRWILALSAGTVLSHAAVERLMTPYVREGDEESFYGYGWSISEQRLGSKLVGHDGGNGIFSADLRRYLGHELLVIVFSSTASFPAPTLADRIEEMLGGADVELPPASDPISVQESAAWVGAYLVRPGDTLFVRRDGPALRLAGSGCASDHLLMGGGQLDGRDALVAWLQTVWILERAQRGDYQPLQSAVRPGTSAAARERLRARQESYADMQRRRSGPLVSVEPVRCMPHRDQLKVVVRMQHAAGVWYRSLRWRDGHVVGYGLHELLPGGEASVPFHGIGPGLLRSFSIAAEVAPVTIRFDAAGGRTVLVLRSEGAEVRAEKLAG